MNFTMLQIIFYYNWLLIVILFAYVIIIYTTEQKHIYMNIYTLNVLPAIENEKNCGKYFPMNATGHVPEF